MNFRTNFKLIWENKHILYSQMIDKLFFFILFVFLARFLDFVSYGSLIISFTFANLMVMVFSSGFPIYLQREIAFRKNESDFIFSKLFSINLFLILLSIIISFFIFKFIYPNLENRFFIFSALLIIVVSSENLLVSLLRGLNQYSTIFLYTFYSKLLILIIIVIIWLSFSDINFIIYIYLLGSLLSTFIFIFVIKNKLNLKIFSAVNYIEAKFLFLTTIPIWCATLFNFLYDKVDIFIISKIVDIEQLSFYSVAYGIFKSSTLSFNFLLIGGLSRVTSFTGNRYGLRIFLLKYSKILLIISTIIFCILFFGAEQLLPFIYSEKYINSIIILKVLSFAIIPLSFNNLTGVIMNGIGMYKENMYVTIIGFLFNFAANIIVIPFFGIIGAAYITVLTEIIILTGDFYFIRKKLIN